MPSIGGTISYQSREAGQQVTGATYVNASDDAGLIAIKDAMTPFQVVNAWSKVNVNDAITTGDNSAIAGCKEARMTFTVAGGALAFMHIPFVRSVIEISDLTATFVDNNRAAGGFYTDRDGNKFETLVKCEFVNIIP